jgi:hypothetical protein
MLRAVSIHDPPPSAKHLEMVTAACITSGRGEGKWVSIVGLAETEFGKVFATVVLDGEAIRKRVEDLRV